MDIRKSYGVTANRMGAWVVLAIMLAAVGVSAQTTWNTASSGVWSNSLNWSAGVPTFNAANLTPVTASYTVTVDATPLSPFTDLTIQNGVGNTTTLDIDATGFTSTNGLFTFGRGAVVNVNSDGEMQYKGGRLVSTEHFILSIKDGGVWRLNGGTVNFTDLPLTAGRHYMYVGNASIGRLEVASGRLNITSVTGGSITPTLNIGYGTAGQGRLDMSGGLIYIKTAGQQGLAVANGTRSYGEVLLTNNATLSVSNWITIAGSQQSTGIIHVAGNSSFDSNGRTRVGDGAGALGIVNVSENGKIPNAATGFYLGGYDSNSGGGTGILNVTGGSVYGYPITAGRNYKSGTSAYGEVNISDGWLGMEASWLNATIAIAETSDAQARAVYNVSGGAIDFGGNKLADRGVVLGALRTNSFGWAVSPPNSTAHGTINLSGSGVMTNRGDLILGNNAGGTGVVRQSGGSFVNLGTTRQIVIGFQGGIGSYEMMDGAFSAQSPVHVGGKENGTLNSTGTLEIAGGTFTVSENDLIVGDAGKGTLTLSGGTLSVRDFDLASGEATLAFDFQSGTIGSVTVTGTMTIDPGAKLEIDASGAVPGVRHTLVSCGTRTDLFDVGNITVLGGDPGWVDQDSDSNIYLYKPAGTLISIR